MKKTLLSLLLLTTLSTFAQDKGHIAISLGPSFPMGDLANKSVSEEKSGLAKTGAVVDISFAYLLGKYVGVTAQLRGQSNPTDNKAIRNELLPQLPAGVTADVDTGNWGVGSLMVGGYGSLPLGTKVRVEPKVMLGFASVSSPTFDTFLTNGFNTGWVKQESATATGFAYLVGVGFKFDIAKRICLLGNLDYFATKADFDRVEVVSSTGDLDYDSFTQPLQTINISVGVGYRL